MFPTDPFSIVPVLRPAAAGALEAVGDPRQQILQRVLAGQLGKSLQGQVLAKLADGSFVVRVADTPARMPLPPGTQVGAELPMKLVALTPRPTFAVGAGFAEAGPPLPEGADPAAEPLAWHEQGPAARALARATTLLGGAMPQAAGETGAGDAGANTFLSPAGRLLGSVLSAALESGTAPSAVKGQAPVVPTPTLDPAALAPALRQALAKSGLFYESHVAEWAQGQRPLADLSAEPQMAAAARPPGPTEPETAGFINLQLVSHEQGQVTWQGQLWPGQALHWEIRRDAPERGEAGEDGQDGGGRDAAQAWHSRLRLNLPQLGELTARITLAGAQVQVQVEAGTQAAALLRRHGGQLGVALDAAGTPLTGLAIRDTPGAS